MIKYRLLGLNKEICKVKFIIVLGKGIYINKEIYWVIGWWWKIRDF